MHAPTQGKTHVRATLLSATLLCTVTTSAQVTPPAQIDAAEIEKKVNGSYYHPRGVDAISCDLQMDWPSFLHLTGLDPDSVRAKYLENATFHFETAPKTPTEFEEHWPKEKPSDLTDDARGQFGNGVRMMVDGFFRSFWTLMDTKPAPPEAHLAATLNEDGSYTLRSTTGGTNNEVLITSDFLPSVARSKSNIKTDTVKLGFTPTIPATEGDHARLTSIDATTEMGVNSNTGQLHFDYQDVRGFHIPKTVYTAVPDAFAITFTFANCSVRKTGEKNPETSVTVKQTVNGPVNLGKHP